MPFWNMTPANGIQSIRTGSGQSTVLSGEAFKSPPGRAPRATRRAILRAHGERYFDFLERSQPKWRLYRSTTAIPLCPPGTWDAALRSAGAGVKAVDEVMQGSAGQCFLPRPAARSSRGAGKSPWLLPVRNAAIAAFHAQACLPSEWPSSISMCITATVLRHVPGRPSFFYASTHQMPLFSGVGSIAERGEKVIS